MKLIIQNDFINFLNLVLGLYVSSSSNSAQKAKYPANCSLLLTPAFLYILIPNILKKPTACCAIDYERERPTGGLSKMRVAFQLPYASPPMTAKTPLPLYLIKFSADSQKDSVEREQICWQTLYPESRSHLHLFPSHSTKRPCAIVLPLLTGSELHAICSIHADVIQAFDRQPEPASINFKKAYDYCYQNNVLIIERLYRIIRDLHRNKNIQHNDIKPENVLCDIENLTINLIDFGF